MSELSRNANISEVLLNATQKVVENLKSGEDGVILPIVTFIVGVLGNGLAIATLVAAKYREGTLLSRTSSSFSHKRHSSAATSRLAGNFNEAPSILSRFKSGGRRTVRAAKLCRKLRQNMKALQVLVLVLLSVDLIGILATAPITFHMYRHNHSIMHEGGTALCSYSAFAMTFFGLATMAILATLAVFCLESIRNSFQFRSDLTVRKIVTVISVLIGLCAAICAVPAVFNFTPRQMHPNSWCFSNWRSKEIRERVFNYVYAALGMFLIATTMICNSLSIIGLLLSRHRFSVKSGSCHGGNEIKTDTVIQLSVLTLIYIVCWTPLVIRILDNQVTPQQDGEADRRAIWLATINPMIFPWVYILLRRGFYDLVVGMAKSVTCSIAQDTLFKSRSSIPEIARQNRYDLHTESELLRCNDDSPNVGTVCSVSTVNTVISHNRESLYDNV